MWSKLFSFSHTIPESLAIQSLGKSITYSELIQEITKGARYFQSLGLEEKCIGIALQDKTEEVICCLAALVSGNHFFFIPHQSTDQLFEQVPIDLLVTDLGLGEGSGKEKISWKKIEGKIGHLHPWWEDSAYSERSFCVFSTSGSTGLAKYVLHDYQSIEEDTQRQIEENEIGEGDKIDFLFAASFSSSLASIFPALCAGATLVIQDLKKTKLGDIPFFWEEFGITMSTLTSSAFRAICRMMREEAQTSTRSIRFLCLGGEPVIPSDLDLMERYFSPETVLQLAYASTETRTIASFKAKTKATEIHDGFPVRKKQVKIVDPQGNPCEPGKVGEVFVQSFFISKGYWKDLEFYPHPTENGKRIYATGDLACWHERGYIQLKGRVHSHQKINGTLMDLHFLETTLATLSAAPCKVLVLRDEIGLEFLVAVFETKEILDEKSLRASLGKYPKLSLVPRKYLAIEQFPLNLHGKVDREPLEVWVKETTLEFLSEQIENPILRKVHEIWSRALGVSILNLNADFFTELGGDSLLAELVLEEISQTLELNIPSHLIHEFRSIRRLGEYLVAKSVPKLPCLEKWFENGDPESGWIIFIEPGFFNSFEVLKGELKGENLNIACLRVDFYAVLEDNDVDNLIESWTSLVKELNGITWVATSFNGWLAAKFGERVGGSVVMMDTPSYQNSTETQLSKGSLSRVRNLLKTTLQSPSSASFKKVSLSGLSFIKRKIQFKGNSPTLFEQCVIRYIRSAQPPRKVENLLFIYSILSLTTSPEDPAEWKSKTAGRFELLEIAGDHLDACTLQFGKKVASAIVGFHQACYSHSLPNHRGH
jgi:acyl-coenzyme A synthetase/AMP-(fatty) acid ligase/acyl carrier protein